MSKSEQQAATIEGLTQAYNALHSQHRENVLTIRGSRRQGDDVPEGRYFLRECFWGPFARRVTLPGPIDARKVRATFSKDCILKILIPREEKVKIVKINEA